MQEFKNLGPDALKAMLTQLTKEYADMLFSDKQEGIHEHEEKIFQLQEEINSRNRAASTYHMLPVSRPGYKGRH